MTGQDSELARDPAARSARLPSLAWRTTRDALRSGPVLVQVPRRGYLPALACERCRAPARCARCAGPLALTSGHAVAHCRWCGRPAGGWRCGGCDGGRFRAQVIGARRTAEELGRAFPEVPVCTSGRDGVLTTVPGTPALVIATPGAEPVAAGGYAAALLLDAWALVDRPDLRAGEEALRRWLAAAALVRPADHGGTVVLHGQNELAPVQALLRWDPATFADRELADRAALGFPPAVRLASLTGPPDAIADFLAGARLPPGTEVLGPVQASRRPRPQPDPQPDPHPAAAPPTVPTKARRAASTTAPSGSSPPADARPPARALVRVPRSAGAALAAALHAAQAVRSARKATDMVRVSIDPLDLG